MAKMIEELERKMERQKDLRRTEPNNIREKMQAEISELSREPTEEK